MEIVTNALTVIVAMRWFFVIVGFALLGVVLADALADLRQARAEIARLRNSNRILLAHQRSRRERRPIIAGRVIR